MKIWSREQLEEKQVSVYMVVLVLALGIGLFFPSSTSWYALAEPVIAALLFTMFCQIPFLEGIRIGQYKTFFRALLVGNFLVIPLLVALLVAVFSLRPLVELGVLLVLLTPCIDYVIVFSHLGKGNASLMLAATPLLFVCQVLLLPLYLLVLLDSSTVEMIAFEPFLHSFWWMIMVPLIAAFLVQVLGKRSVSAQRVLSLMAWGPVPLMALTFLIIVASQVGTLVEQFHELKEALPVYIAFGCLAPLLGKWVARLTGNAVAEARTVAFSMTTRNSLVVLPLALALPAPENQVVALVIVGQTFVEILFELCYIRIIPRVIK